MRPVLKFKELVERVVELDHGPVATEWRSRRRAARAAGPAAGTARTFQKRRPASPRAPFQLAVALFMTPRQARAVLDATQVVAARRGEAVVFSRVSSFRLAEFPGRVREAAVGAALGAAVGAAVGALVMVGAGLIVGDAEGTCVSVSAVTREQKDGISSVGPIWRLAPATNASCAGPCRATPRAVASEEISSSGS